MSALPTFVAILGVIVFSITSGRMLVDASDETPEIILGDAVVEIDEVEGSARLQLSYSLPITVIAPVGSAYFIRQEITQSGSGIHAERVQEMTARSSGESHVMYVGGQPVHDDSPVHWRFVISLTDGGVPLAQASGVTYPKTSGAPD